MLHYIRCKVKANLAVYSVCQVYVTMLHPSTISTRTNFGNLDLNIDSPSPKLHAIPTAASQYSAIISDRYRPDRNPVGPITVRYRFKQNTSWAPPAYFKSSCTERMTVPNYFGLSLISTFRFLHSDSLHHYSVCFLLPLYHHFVPSFCLLQFWRPYMLWPAASFVFLAVRRWRNDFFFFFEFLKRKTKQQHALFERIANKYYIHPVFKLY